jgi:hypothetical protein
MAHERRVDDRQGPVEQVVHSIVSDLPIHGREMELTTLAHLRLSGELSRDGRPPFGGNHPFHLDREGLLARGRNGM